jgi:hypothetical protein
MQASYVAIALVIGGIAAGMISQWRGRERAIQRALQKRDDPWKVEAILPLLDECIDKLIAEYGTDTFSRNQVTDVPPFAGDRRERVLDLVHLAAHRWEVSLPTIQLSIVPHDERERTAATFQNTAPWAFQASSSGTLARPEGQAWTICVDPAFLHDDLALIAIVAHEVAHGVLERDQVTLGEPGRDEVLTDVAAALVGFGQIMLQLQRRVERRFEPRGGLSYTIGGPGYLGPLELAHILARHKEVQAQTAA